MNVQLEEVKNEKTAWKQFSIFRNVLAVTASRFSGNLRNLKTVILFFHMKRRTFLHQAALLSAAALSELPNQAADDRIQVEDAIRAAYSVYFQNRDKEKYRSLLTEDYILLEHGEMMDVRSELAAIPKRENPVKRTDYFDFKSIKVHGEVAYAVYELKYEVLAKNRSRKGHCLESAILRRVRGDWLICLLHSTRMPDHELEFR